MSIVRYLREHWSGEQSLAWSFWINLVALRVIAFVMQGVWIGFEGERRGLPVVPVALAVLAIHGVLPVWQVVGVVRAGEAYVTGFGSRANALGSQLGVVVLLLLTFTYSIEAYQTTLDPPPAEHATERMAREHDASYTIEVLDNGHEIRLDGLIASGVTRRLRTFLDEHPSIDGIVLDSEGGNVYEGRGLAKLFFERGVATRVESLCTSACTLAFIGGKRRTLGREARFGLHGYRLESTYAIIVTDPESEQRRDRALFRKAGVASWFVKRMFDARADEMWWPQADELLRAGVIQESVQ